MSDVLRSRGISLSAKIHEQTRSARSHQPDPLKTRLKSAENA
jgi:hypothetical protein